jgi:tetratricopeptide (TPR) repeat protein
MLSRGFALVAFCVVGMLGTAMADGKQQADKLFEEGRNLLAAGDQNAAAACEKFSEAIKLDPEAPGTMLNLGLCNEKLMKYKTALYWFRKAQARAAETNLPDYENAAKEHTILLKRDKVATIKIEFPTPAPAGTKVKIDDDDVAPADFLAAEVDPGEHTLVAGAPGKVNVVQKFNVEGRGGQTLTIEFVDGDNFTVVDRGAGRRKVAIITAAGGGALMIASGILSYLSMKEYEKCAKNGSLDFDDDGIYPEASCPETDAQAAVDYANKYQKRAQVWGTTLFVAGAVAVGVAGVLYFTAPEKERIDRTVFAPMVSPTEIGLAASGSF